MKNILKKITLFLLLATFTAAGTACQKTETASKIAVIVKSQNSTYWDFLKCGVDDAAKELGYDISFEAPPSEADIAIQEDLIKKAVNDKACAIVVAPIDSDSLNDELTLAHDAGIPVVCVDSECSFEDKVTFISSNNYNAGAIEGRKAGEILLKKGGGTIAIVGHTEGAGNAVGRISGFVDTLVTQYGASVEGMGKDKYISNLGMSYEDALETGKKVAEEKHLPEIKIVGIAYCNAQKDLAIENTEKFLKDYPDLTMLFATNSKTTIGACEKVKEMDYSRKVTILGFDLGNDQAGAINSQVLEGVIAQNPYNMGYFSIRCADKSLHHADDIEPVIDTGVTYVNKDNLKDENIQFLMNPENIT